MLICVGVKCVNLFEKTIKQNLTVAHKHVMVTKHLSNVS